MKKDTPKDVPACPRGFHWCDKREECIPDGTGAEDKLEKRQQRYFFKEETCPEGTTWCPNSKKCIPLDAQKSKGHGKGKGFGKGEGPVGTPKKEELEIDRLVDEVFAGGFAQFGKQRKVERKIDRILDGLKQDDEDTADFGKDDITTSGRPYAAPIQMKVVTTIDGKAELSQECGMNGGPMGGGFEDGEYDEGPAKPDNPQKHSNDINQVPDQDAPALLNSIRKQLSEMKKDDAYKKYFKAALKRYGYNSPADIPADKKKQFFNAIDKGWKATNEGVFSKLNDKRKESACKSLKKDIASFSSENIKKLCSKKKTPEDFKKCVQMMNASKNALIMQKKKTGCK